MSEVLQDVFNDSPDEESNFDTSTSNESEPEESNSDQVSNKTEPDETGEKPTDGPPPEEKDNTEVIADETGKKFIPEHRFKAALKSVSDELEVTRAKLTEYEQNQQESIPDKDVDPEGHDLHIRLKASDSIMRELRSDYLDVVEHYKEMAKTNPLLNEAVAADPIPAKLAYDIAKQDLRIKEALSTIESDDWKEFQTWKQSKNKVSDDVEIVKSNDKFRTNLLGAPPNLNRSTSVSPGKSQRQPSKDDDLFAGAL
jgi:hypothetical protein